MIKFTVIFNSICASNEVKIRTFDIYIASIFLYNSELWGASDSNNKSIGVFCRRILRIDLDIRLPRKISNKKLYPQGGTQEKNRMTQNSNPKNRITPDANRKKTDPKV